MDVSSSNIVACVPYIVIVCYIEIVIHVSIGDLKCKGSDLKGSGNVYVYCTSIILIRMYSIPSFSIQLAPTNTYKSQSNSTPTAAEYHGTERNWVLPFQWDCHTWRCSPLWWTQSTSCHVANSWKQLTRHVHYIIVKTVTDSDEEDVNQVDGSTTRARDQNRQGREREKDTRKVLQRRTWRWQWCWSYQLIWESQQMIKKTKNLKRR